MPTGARPGLSAFVALFGLVCLGIGIAHIVIGPGVIPGSIAVNPTMDSEDRFYATLFVGFGAGTLELLIPPLLWWWSGLVRR